jgi:FKBP-type peptidyl-prolyl cis-trans isomerase 2
MKKLIFGLFLVLLLAFGCIGPQTPPVQQNTTNVTTVKAVKLGDVVLMDYTVRYANGTIIETSIADVAKKEGIYSAGNQYSAVSFPISYDVGLIPGFVTGVLGMKQDETKTFAISPDQGYGKYDPNLYYSMPLYYNLSKFEKVPRSIIEEQNKTIEKDSVLKYDHNGMVVISDFDNDTVTLEYMFEINYSFRVFGYPYVVINSTNDTLFLKLDVKKGDSFKVSSEYGPRGYATVKDINDTAAILDENHLLAGETLYYTVIVKSIQ